MRERLTPAQVSMVWAQITAQCGARRETAGEITAAILECAFERADLDARVAFRADGKVARFFITPAAPRDEAGPPPYADPAASPRARSSS